MRRSFQNAVLLCAILLGLSLSASGCAGSGEVSVHGPEEDSRLTVCTALPEEIWVPMVEEFENRTGIWVQVESGNSAELLGQVAAEGGAFCDLVLGVSGENLEACGSLFLPYESGLSSRIQPDYQVPGGLWTPFSVLPVVLIYNSHLVRDNPPAGWDALLNSAWRGRIAFADPAADGASFAALSVLRQLFPGEDSAGGEDAVPRAFAANLDGRQFRFSSDVIAEVSRGNCYIGVTAEDAALRNMSEGGDIAIVYPREGACVFCDGMAIVSGCAHEDNARRFIDFVLGEDVQRFLADVCARRSVLSSLAGEKQEVDP